MRVEITRVQNETDAQEFSAKTKASITGKSGTETWCELLPNPYPASFHPEYIIWCKYRFKTDEAPLELQITNEMYKYPISYPGSHNGIEEFIRNVVGDRVNHPHASMAWKPQPPVPPIVGFKAYGPADIGVEKQSYVLLELVSDNDWNFRSTDCGITTEVANLASNFDPVHHVQGVAAPPGTYPKNCKLVYFSVLYRQAYEIQKFNFHVELVNDKVAPGYTIGIVIDPDIRNTGAPTIPPPAPPGP